MYCPTCNLNQPHQVIRGTVWETWKCQKCGGVTHQYSVVDGTQHPTGYDYRHRRGEPLRDDGKWQPGRPIVIGLLWSEELYKWGIPFERAKDDLRILREQDARAFDAARRVPRVVAASEREAERLKRATFERARRDQKFLDALEMALVARFYGGLAPEAVTEFIKQQIPEPYELLWQHDLRLEEAAAAVVAAARRLDSDGSAQVNAALAELDQLLAEHGPLDAVREVLAPREQQAPYDE